jgi:hypothetical protein
VTLRWQQFSEVPADLSGANNDLLAMGFSLGPRCCGPLSTGSRVYRGATRQ